MDLALLAPSTHLQKPKRTARTTKLVLDHVSLSNDIMQRIAFSPHHVDLRVDLNAFTNSISFHQFIRAISVHPKLYSAVFDSRGLPRASPILGCTDAFASGIAESTSIRRFEIKLGKHSIRLLIDLISKFNEGAIPCKFTSLSIDESLAKQSTIPALLTGNLVARLKKFTFTFNDHSRNIFANDLVTLFASAPRLLDIELTHPGTIDVNTILEWVANQDTSSLSCTVKKLSLCFPSHISEFDIPNLARLLQRAPLTQFQWLNPHRGHLHPDQFTLLAHAIINNQTLQRVSLDISTYSTMAFRDLRVAIMNAMRTGLLFNINHSYGHFNTGVSWYNTIGFNIIKARTLIMSKNLAQASNSPFLRLLPLDIRRLIASKVGDTDIARFWHPSTPSEVWDQLILQERE